MKVTQIPMIDWHERNTKSIEVTIGTLRICYSYRTAVAFYHPTTGYVVRQNIWGPTTGRHMNEFADHEIRDRVDGTKFNDILLEILNDD